MTAAGSRKISVRRRTILAAVIAVAGFAGAANAYADPVDLQVVDRDTGRVLPVWRHLGRLFVAGEPGSRYSLRVNNHTDRRILVVVSVDRVNILTGETANYDQRGYVFKPYESYDVSGWRKSNTEVAAFTFAPLPQSYAARTGRPSDVGVIGMAVFNERVPVPVPYPEASASGRDRSDEPEARYSGGLTRQRSASPAIALVQPPPPVAVPAPAGAGFSDRRAMEVTAQRREEKLGTAHGAREWSVVDTVDFERATVYPQTVRQIEYDTYANLAARGVIAPVPDIHHRPRPFPSNGAGYVADPPPGS